jgi:Na+/H+ antiporter NhaD/arsenite permease-like protein
MIDGFAIATLVVFIISIFFVIVPVRIPLPRSQRFPTYIPINLTTAPILAIAILWAARCLGPSVIRAGIVGTEGIKPYNIMILLFSLAYMSITLDITGILQAAAFWVSNKGGSNGWKLVFYFYVLITLLSVICGNDPVILSGTAFLVYYTDVVKLHPIPWLIVEFAAANTASMVLFVGNPTNVVICEGFGVNSVAYSAYTIFPFIACSIFCFVALAAQFHDKHIPKHLDKTEELDPWSVLHDPIGACVGSCLLGACLVVIIAVSFFGVDVWKISLPFAAVKFIFDISWDHWRDSRCRLTRPREPGLQSTDHESGTAGGTVDVENQVTVASSSSANTNKESLSDSWASFMSSTATAANTTSSLASSSMSFFGRQRSSFASLRAKLDQHFPTFSIALPRLPFALVLFAFSQFILIEALAHQGWIDIFAIWLVRVTGRQVYPTIWIIGVFGVVLCNLAGTNIGATILLTKVVRAAALPNDSLRAAAIALAVASNIGAVSFTFSASLAGLLWRGIIEQKGIHIKQTTFAFWNLLPITIMTVAGLGVVCIEMAVIYR